MIEIQIGPLQNFGFVYQLGTIFSGPRPSLKATNGWFKEGRGGEIFFRKNPPPRAAEPAPLVSRTRAMPVNFLHSHTPHTKGRPNLTL